MLEYPNRSVPRPGKATFASELVGWSARRLGWLLMGFFVVGGLCVAQGIVFGPVVGYMTPIDVLLLLVCIAVLARGVRRTRDQAALNYLEQAVRLNLPLPAMLAAAEVGERFGVKARLIQLRRLLEDGAPIGAAVDRALPTIPLSIRGLIGAGERAGRIAPALSRAVARGGPRSPDDVTTQIFLRWYPIVLTFFTGGTALLFLVVVLPKYQGITRAFGIPLPASARWMMAAGEWAPVAGGVAAAALLLFCGRMMAMLFSAPPWDAGPLQRPWDELLWHLPIARSVVRSRTMADAFGVIADALEAGRPLDWAAGEAARVPTNRVLQRRLERWRTGLTTGDSPADAARAARLPRMATALLATAQAAGNAPEVFRFLARYYDGKFSRAAYLLRGAIIPGMALFFGVIVALLALSVFQPMVSLVEQLGGSRLGVM